MGGPVRNEGSERLLTRTFRRLMLSALRKGERLSERFHDQLLTSGHEGGFSADGDGVFAVPAGAGVRVELR